MEDSLLSFRLGLNILCEAIPQPNVSRHSVLSQISAIGYLLYSINHYLQEVKLLHFCMFLMLEQKLQKDRECFYSAMQSST